jgi:hypothetical protein
MAHVYITREIDRRPLRYAIHLATQRKKVCTMMHKVQIGATNATCMHSDQHFAFTRNWLGESINHHMTRTQHSSFHMKTLVTLN